MRAKRKTQNALITLDRTDRLSRAAGNPNLRLRNSLRHPPSKAPCARVLLSACALLLFFVAVPAQANEPPMADAGSDKNIYTGDETTLHGSAKDPDGDSIVSWLWTVESAPSGSSPCLSSRRVPDPGFRASEAGDYILSLVVSDGIDESMPDYVTIHVADNTPTTAVADADDTSAPAR